MHLFSVLFGEKQRNNNNNNKKQGKETNKKFILVKVIFASSLCYSVFSYLS